MVTPLWDRLHFNWQWDSLGLVVRGPGGPGDRDFRDPLAGMVLKTTNVKETGHRKRRLSRQKPGSIGCLSGQAEEEVPKEAEQELSAGLGVQGAKARSEGNLESIQGLFPRGGRVWSLGG